MSRITISDAWSSCAMLPGPNTTLGTPALLYCPASVP